MREVINFANHSFDQFEEYRKVQEDKINNLKESISIEKERSKESQMLAKDAKQMTKQQLELIKLVITEDAKVESKKAFLFGVAISFPIGIASSMTAAYFLGFFK